MILLVLSRFETLRVSNHKKGNPMTVPRETLKAIESAMTSLKERGYHLWWHYAKWEPVALHLLGLSIYTFEEYYRTRPTALAEYQRGLRNLYETIAAEMTDKERETIRLTNETVSSANMDFLWDDVLS